MKLFLISFCALAAVFCVASTPLYGQNPLLMGREDLTGTGSQKRLALVIGNAAYTKTGKLYNTVNDANDMAAALRSLGFEVLSGTDQSKRQMEALIREFGDKLARQGGVGVFYYSGHGLQNRGNNYLVPVEADIPAEDEIEYATVNLNLVLGKMDAAKNNLNIVILDACRNNPFARSWRNFRDLGDSNGLARVTPPVGTIMIYATQPGNVASDGTVRNGLFTGALLQQIKKPNLELDAMLKLVARDLAGRSGGKQLPWKEGIVLGDFYFAGIGTTGGSGSPASSNSVAVPAGAVRTNRIGMELAYIPPGDFIMGSSDSEVDRSFAIAKRYSEGTRRDWLMRETPQRRVSIKEGFWMGRYEVTQGQWQAVMGTDIRQQRDKSGGSNPVFDGEVGANFPMFFVSWEDAREFVKRLNAMNDGFVYSLPSEAQWEYAARAGTSTLYYWGDDETNTAVCSYANGPDQSNVTAGGQYNSPCRDGHFFKSPVGLFRPNNFGLYDMSGNVSELTEDIFNPSYANVPSDGSANLNAGTYAGKHDLRASRGGDARGNPYELRSATRLPVSPTGRHHSVGFRVVARPR